MVTNLRAKSYRFSTAVITSVLGQFMCSCDAMILNEILLHYTKEEKKELLQPESMHDGMSSDVLPVTTVRCGFSF